MQLSKFQDTPSPDSTCQGPADLCGGRAGSWGVIRVRPVEIIRLKQTEIWPCGWRPLHKNPGACWVGDGKIALIQEPHNSVFPHLSHHPEPAWTSWRAFKKVCTTSTGWPTRDTFLLRGEPMQLRYAPHILNHHTWVQGQSFWCLCFSYQSQRGFFCISFV